MQIERIMNFLDENINDVDRKLFTKLSIHIKKSNTRSLNMLASKYNIDKKLYMFPPNSQIDNVYLNRLEELILTCRRVVIEKIDISSFNVERFHVKKVLDLSNLNKLNELLRHIKTFNVKHDKISVSKEVVESPLLILTLTTKKRLDLEVLEKHAFDYFSNYALVEDKVKPVSPEMSILNVAKKNYILDKSIQSDLKPEIVKEAILDYFKASGEFYYISAETEEKVSKDVHAMIERKNTSVAKKSSFVHSLLEFFGPLVALITSLIVLIVTAITGSNLNFVAYLLFAYTIFNTGLYMYRHGLVKGKEDSFSAQYYEQKPGKFLKFGLIILGSYLVQLIYIFIFGNEVSDGLSSLGSFLNGLYYNSGVMAALSIILCVMLLGGITATLKLSKYHVSEIFTAISALLLFIVFSIRTHFWQFAAFRDYSISFTAIGVGILMFLLINSDRGKIKNSILLSIFVLDFIILMASNNQFYLRSLFAPLFG